MTQSWAMVIVGVLTLLGTIIVQVNGNRVNAYRLQQLEEKVNKHNNIVERTYKTEETIAVLKTEIGNLKDEVDGLRERSS